MATHEVDQHAPHHAMSISKLRADPPRMLVEFGTPIAFATTGLLRLAVTGLSVPGKSAPGYGTGIRDHATLSIAIHVLSRPGRPAVPQPVPA